jgi:hypothetical protein
MTFIFLRFSVAVLRECDGWMNVGVRKQRNCAKNRGAQNMIRIILKSDEFRMARGGHARLLEVACGKCGERICFYQKDGPGALKRMYIDRMFIGRVWANGAEFDSRADAVELECSRCRERVGTRIVYEKEQRFAFHLLEGSTRKRRVSCRSAEMAILGGGRE